MGIRFKVVKKKATSLRANRFRAAIVCFNSIMVVLAASALSSCKVNAPATTTEATSTTNYDVILAHCFSPQGNGGNRASLLG